MHESVYQLIVWTIGFIFIIQINEKIHKIVSLLALLVIANHSSALHIRCTYTSLKSNRKIHLRRLFGMFWTKGRVLIYC